MDFGQRATCHRSGNVNSIRQDPVNRNLLYAPTEMGFFVSLDDGKSWDTFMPNLPIGRVDEVLVHPRDHDLILATHSRSVWILDDASALEPLTPEVRAKDAALLPTRDAVAWKSDRRLSPRSPPTSAGRATMHRAERQSRGISSPAAVRRRSPSRTR